MVSFVKIRIFPLQSHFGRGAYIVRQGAAGDTFYIISEGKVKVTQKKEGMLIKYRVIMIMMGWVYSDLESSPGWRWLLQLPTANRGWNIPNLSQSNPGG